MKIWIPVFLCYSHLNHQAKCVRNPGMFKYQIGKQNICNIQIKSIQGSKMSPVSFILLYVHYH